MAGGRPRRQLQSNRAKRVVLLFTEGEKTEVQYFRAWERQHRDQVNLVISDLHGLSPLRLVEAAVEDKQRRGRAVRRGRDSPVDSIWCVCDVDEFRDHDAARSLAALHGINLVVSNPCIELWFLLHHRDQTAWIDRHAASHDFKELSGDRKALSESTRSYLLEHYRDARGRARHLERKHRGDGSARGENPSSDVWRLVDEITGGQLRGS